MINRSINHHSLMSEYRKYLNCVSFLIPPQAVLLIFWLGTKNNASYSYSPYPMQSKAAGTSWDFWYYLPDHYFQPRLIAAKSGYWQPFPLHPTLLKVLLRQHPRKHPKFSLGITSKCDLVYLAFLLLFHRLFKNKV